MTSSEDGAHRRRPPLPAVLCGAQAVGVEAAGDIRERAASGVVAADTGDEVGVEAGLAARRWRTSTGCPNVLASFGEVALELVDGDQPGTPLCF